MFFALALAAVFIVVLVAGAYVLERQGRKSEQNDQMEQVLDDIHAANMARDRLLRSPAFARRVRGLFTRRIL